VQQRTGVENLDGISITYCRNVGRIAFWRQISNHYWEGRTFIFGRARFKRDGTSAETRIRLSEKRTSPFESVGVSI
jgi:hypothetical protein